MSSSSPQHARSVRMQGDRIRELRKLKGMNQEQLAALAKCNVKTIGNIECGRAVDTFTGRRVANALGVLPATVIAEGSSLPDEQQIKKPVKIGFEVTIDFAQFDECENVPPFREWIERAVQHYFRITGITEGSTWLELEVEEGDAHHLLKLFCSDIRPPDAVAIKVPDDEEFLETAAIALYMHNKTLPTGADAQLELFKRILTESLPLYVIVSSESLPQLRCSTDASKSQLVFSWSSPSRRSDIPIGEQVTKPDPSDAFKS